MREPERKEIGGKVYEVTPMPAGKGLGVMQRMAKAAAPAVLKAARGETGGELVAIADLVESLASDDLAAIAKLFAEHAMVGDGENMVKLSTVFDVHFAGDYLALFEWLAFAAKVNFGPLLDGLKRRAAQRAVSAVEAPRK